jgi:hypothetical protein
MPTADRRKRKSEEMRKAEAASCGLKRGMVFFFKKGTLHIEFTKKGT